MLKYLLAAVAITVATPVLAFGQPGSNPPVCYKQIIPGIPNCGNGDPQGGSAPYVDLSPKTVKTTVPPGDGIDGKNYHPPVTPPVVTPEEPETPVVEVPNEPDPVDPTDPTDPETPTDPEEPGCVKHCGGHHHGHHKPHHDNGHGYGDNHEGRHDGKHDHAKNDKDSKRNGPGGTQSFD